MKDIPETFAYLEQQCILMINQIKFIDRIYFKTFDGEQWVTAEFLVLGNSIIKHFINKELVLTYAKPKIGGGNVSNYDTKIKLEGKALSGVYIAQQSESHPFEFRKVALFNLEP